MGPVLMAVAVVTMLAIGLAVLALEVIENVTKVFGQ